MDNENTKLKYKYIYIYRLFINGVYDLIVACSL
jgi:hypothetical protein